MSVQADLAATVVILGLMVVFFIAVLAAMAVDAVTHVLRSKRRRRA